MAVASAYDYEIAGLPFIGAVGPDFPYERALARVFKDRVDQSAEPGDQSFDGSWIRSQTDWTGGAGYRFAEPVSEDPIPRSFNWSFGTDPFKEKGQLHLCHQPLLVDPSPTGDSGTEWGSIANTKYGETWITCGNRIQASAGLGLPWTTMNSDAGDIATLESTPQGVVWANRQGVWRSDPGPISGSSHYSQMYSSGGLQTRAWYVKDRLIVWRESSGLTPKDSVFALPMIDGGAVPLADPVVEDWNFDVVDATEGPAGIVLAVNRGTQGALYLLTIDSDGGIPTLTYPVQIAVLPKGEMFTHIDSSMNMYLMLGTTLGVRLGLFNDEAVTYGPLHPGCPPVTGGFTSWSRFMYAPVADAGEGRSGVVEFDLSEVTNEQRVAYSFTWRVPDGTPTVLAVASVNATQIDMLAGGGLLFGGDATNPKETYGYNTAGWIRYGTTVDKAFTKFKIDLAPESVGRVTAYLYEGIDTAGNDVRHEIGTISSPDISATWDIDPPVTASKIAVQLALYSDTLPPPPIEPPVIIEPPPVIPDTPDGTYAGLLTLTFGEVKLVTYSSLPNPTTRIDRATGESPNPIVESWGLYATPVVDRAELVRVGLLCFDTELDQNGSVLGGMGTAIERYEELAAAVQEGAFTLHDINNDRSYVVTVEDLSFRQTAPGTRTEGFGGLIELTVRAD